MQDIPNGQATPPPPLSEPVQPTVSAWSTRPTPEPDVAQVPLPAPASRFGDNLLFFGVILLAQIGFSVIFAYLIFALGQRTDHQIDALDAKIEKVIRDMDKEAREQAAIKTEQTVRKDVVARVPPLIDNVIAIQRDLAELSASTKVMDVQVHLNRQDIQQLRRDHDLLVTRVQDLTYVRQPKIPLEDKQP